MIIGFYIIDLIPGKIGGAEQYTRNLVLELSKLGHKCVLFVNEDADNTFEENDVITAISLPRVNEGTIHDCMDYYIRQEKVEVLLCPLSYMPHGEFDIPIISTIHDLQYKYYPQYFEEEDLKYRDKELTYAIKNSTAIIAISQFTRRCIEESFHQKSLNMQVIYIGTDDSFEIVNNSALSKKKGDQYILYPANSWPHKNHKTLLEAFHTLVNDYGQDIDLVLTGNVSNEVEDMIKNLNLSDRVHVLGYVDQQKMPILYKNAEVLVFPSLFEGFGMPLIEAMQCGVPVTCSDKGSIPEVAGEAALYFDALNPMDMAEKIRKVLTDEELRQDLIKKGSERYRLFSYKKTAVETEKFISEIVNKHVPKQDKEHTIESRVKTLLYIMSDGDEEKVNRTLESLKHQRDIEVVTRVVDVQHFILDKSEDMVGFLKAGDVLYKNRLIIPLLSLAKRGKGIFLAPFDDNGLRQEVIELSSKDEYRSFMQNMFIGLNFCFFRIPEDSNITKIELFKERFLINYILYSYCDKSGFSKEFGNIVIGKQLDETEE